MNKTILLIIIIVLAGLGIWWLSSTKAPEVVLTPSHQEAELVGFNFMLDFIAIAPPESDFEAMERIYDNLSVSARQQISGEMFSRDLALFVGVQDVPDQGVSVEDFQVINDSKVALIVGLNYSGGRVLRKINLIIEEESWKVDSVVEYDKYEDVVEIPMDERPFVIAVISYATDKFNVSEESISLLSIVEREWPDGCLGLADPDEFCTQALVPGYEVELEVDGEKEIFRVDQSGLVIRYDSRK